MTFEHGLAINKRTGKHPVVMGPILVHSRKQFSNYFYFMSSLVELKPSPQKLKFLEGMERLLCNRVCPSPATIQGSSDASGTLRETVETKSLLVASPNSSTMRSLGTYLVTTLEALTMRGW